MKYELNKPKQFFNPLFMHDNYVQPKYTNILETWNLKNNPKINYLPLKLGSLLTNYYYLNLKYSFELK